MLEHKLPHTSCCLPANEHRASSIPRHRRQSPAARGGATDAADDGRVTLGKHASLQENLHQQASDRGHGALHRDGQLLQPRGQGVRLDTEAP